MIKALDAINMPVANYNEKWYQSTKGYFTGWCSTPTLLLICSSFSRETGHPLQKFARHISHSPDLWFGSRWFGDSNPGSPLRITPSPFIRGKTTNPKTTGPQTTN